MKIDVDTAELKRLAADLATESGRVGRETAAAIRKGGKEIAKAAANSAPYKFGELQGDIESNTYGDGRSSAMTAVIGTTVRQGAFQEYGTSRHAAQPFLGPALAAKGPAVIDELERIAGGLLS